MRCKTLFVLALAPLLLLACAADPLADDGGTTSGGHSPKCAAPADIATNTSCQGSPLGASCPGTQQCLCSGGGFLDTEAACDCEEESDGVLHWKCQADCETACNGGVGGSGATSSSSTGGSSPHDPICDYLLSHSCPQNPTHDECVAQFEEMAAQCPSETAAFESCALGEPLTCVNGSATIEGGCTQEAILLGNCLG